MLKTSLLLSVASLAIAAPAFAQTEAVPTPADPVAVEQDAAPETAQEQTGGDIIVTATRRESRLADVPLAISAVTAETLSNSGANDIRQLNQVAPSLLVSSTGSEANGSARIRGVGTVGDNPGLESSVAVFIDGVYRSRTGVGLNDLGEIERIEVLRGPQGTLSGRNASAGVLNIVSRAPSYDLGGTAELTYGNYDYWRASGSLTGGVTDTLALRVDGVWSQREGFYEDVNTGYRINNRDRYFVRGQALFEPSDAITVRLIADYSKRNEDCCAAVYAGSAIAPGNLNLISPSNPIIPVLLGVSGATFDEYFPSLDDPYARRVATTPGRNYAGETEDYGFSGQIDWNFGGASLTSITAYREYTNTQGADADYGLADILYFGPDSGRGFKTFSQELRLQGSAFENRIDWLIGGYYAHEDLTTKTQLLFGQDYGRFAACRLVASGALSPFFSPGTAGCISPTGQAVLSGAVPGVPSPFGAAGPAIVAGFNRLDTIRGVGDDTANFNQTSENFAFFTHNIVHVTDQIDLTLGLRYTNETKSLSANFNNTNTACGVQQQNLLPLMANPGLAAVAGGLLSLSCQGNSTSGLNALVLDDQRKEDEFTGTAVLSYKPTSDLMFYASYSRGYKAGGFNLDRSAILNPNPAQALPFFPINPANADFYADSLQFDEETVNAYEVGMKYSSRHFTLNVAGFRSEFSNFQLNTFNGTVYVVQNINGCGTDLNGGDRDTSAATGGCSPDDVKAGLVSQGVEIEAGIYPARDVRVNLGLTYSDTKYADQLVGSSEGIPLDPALRLLPGDRMSNAPEFVATSSFTWTPDIGSSGLSGLFYVDSRLSDNYNTGSDLFPQKEQDSFVLVNGRVGLRGPDDRWAIELWGQNLFNKGYTQVGFSSPFQAAGANANFPAATYPGGTQIFSSYLAEPRTYGITLRGKF